MVPACQHIGAAVAAYVPLVDLAAISEMHVA
jgi:hypothetical protein